MNIFTTVFDVKGFFFSMDTWEQFPRAIKSETVLQMFTEGKKSPDVQL